MVSTAEPGFELTTSCFLLSIFFPLEVLLSPISFVLNYLLFVKYVLSFPWNQRTNNWPGERHLTERFCNDADADLRRKNPTRPVPVLEFGLETRELGVGNNAAVKLQTHQQNFEGSRNVSDLKTEKIIYIFELFQVST